MTFWFWHSSRSLFRWLSGTTIVDRYFHYSFLFFSVTKPKNSACWYTSTYIDMSKEPRYWRTSICPDIYSLLQAPTRQSPEFRHVGSFLLLEARCGLFFLPSFFFFLPVGKQSQPSEVELGLQVGVEFYNTEEMVVYWMWASCEMLIIFINNLFCPLQHYCNIIVCVKMQSPACKEAIFSCINLTTSKGGRTANNKINETMAWTISLPIITPHFNK